MVQVTQRRLSRDVAAQAGDTPINRTQVKHVLTAAQVRTTSAPERGRGRLPVQGSFRRVGLAAFIGHCAKSAIEIVAVTSDANRQRR
jgi:hypothetical protein